MSEHTEPGDAPDAQATEEAADPTPAERVRAAVTERGRNGTAAAAAGGLLFVSGGRAVARRRRRVAALLLGAGALAVAVLQRRRSGEDTESVEGPGSTDAADGESTVSAEAYAHRMAASTMNRTRAGPRGVDGEPAVDTDTNPDEGRVRFSTGQDEDVTRKPHVDDADPKDPRYPDEGDPGAEGPVDVSLSKTKMTDELGKVAGPDDDQAYPSREGTDPEPMSERAPPRYVEGGAEDPDGEEETSEADEGTAGADEGHAADDESADEDEDAT